jgi:kynurenine formamidase
MALEGLANLADVPATSAPIVEGAPKFKNGAGGPSRIFALI